MRISFKLLLAIVFVLGSVSGSVSPARARERNLDIELNYLTGIPDLVGLCAEEHWTDPVAVEFCAGTAFLASTLSSHAKRITHSAGNWDLGWGEGVRSFHNIGCFDTCGDGAMYAVAPEALISAEWNPGVRERGWGFTLEFDLGAGWGISIDPSYTGQERFPVYPVGRISFGLAF
jgi:hypothetical protein